MAGVNQINGIHLNGSAFPKEKIWLYFIILKKDPDINRLEDLYHISNITQIKCEKQ